MTPREQEILELLVAGKTDREIADALFVGVCTVEGHVSRILAKLGVRTRTAAASAAVTAGLVARPPPPRQRRKPNSRTSPPTDHVHVRVVRAILGA